MHIDTEDDASDRVVEYFKLEEEDTPTCRLINLDGDMKKYVPDFEGMGADDIRKWINSYLDGTLSVCVCVTLGCDKQLFCLKYTC